MFEQIAAKAPVVAVVGLACVVVLCAVWRYLLSRRSSGKITGAGLGEVILRLRATNAQWPTIEAELNPGNDPSLSKLLKELRGPQMFVPHIALNITEDAYASALQRGAGTNVRDVLIAARTSMERVTKHGD